MISKQEAVVLLGNLDLATCTETVENVSISNSKQLQKADSSGYGKTMMDRYKTRQTTHEQMTLYEYFHHVKNPKGRTKQGVVIPHFVGICGTPRFPITTDYAKHQMIVHKTWRKYPESEDWVSDFHHFINSPTAPISAKMTYQRVHARFLSKTQGYDPTSDIYDHTKNPISCDNKELMELIGLHKNEGIEYDDSILNNMDRGVNFKWDKPARVSATDSKKRD